MNNNLAHLYFRKLEQEAKLANQLSNKTDCGALVRAVRKGIPTSYAHMIANIGFRIPRTYPQWKQCILQMYDERQKQRVFNETHDLDTCHKKHPGNQKQITATSSNKTTGGATSSSTGKAGSSNKGQDSGGQWVPVTMKTYGRQGEPMQVDQAKYMKEGLCFICRKKGHISKDCPDKKPRKEVRTVTMGEDIPLADMTIVKEVKE